MRTLSSAIIFFRCNAGTSGFCDHLQERLHAGLRVAYPDEVMAYERACLELQRPRGNADDAPAPQLIKFQHDPEILPDRLSRGQKPRAVPALNCILLGELDENDKVQWHVLVDKAKPRKRRTPTHVRTNATKDKPQRVK